jgi:hypothetical protein
MDDELVCSAPNAPSGSSAPAGPPSESAKGEPGTFEKARPTSPDAPGSRHGSRGLRTKEAETVLNKPKAALAGHPRPVRLGINSGATCVGGTTGRRDAPPPRRRDRHYFGRHGQASPERVTHLAFS